MSWTSFRLAIMKMAFSVFAGLGVFSLKRVRAKTPRSAKTAQPDKLRKSLLFVFLVICVLISGAYFARRSGTNPGVYNNDFNVYYHAAREIIAGRDPYQNSLGRWTPYIYPPLLAQLIVPLSLLPLTAAAYLWFLVNAVSVCAAAWTSVALSKQSLVKSSTARAAIAACAVAIVFRFVLDNFDLGQVNALVAALAVAHVHLYTRNRKALSAVALAIAVSIKLTPMLLVAYHIARLRFKFAATCIAMLAAITAVSFLAFGSSAPDVFKTFVNRTVKNEQGYDFAYSGNQSLRGAIARLTANERSEPVDGAARRPTDAATGLISLLFLAAALLVAVRSSHELAAVAPFFCCMVLLSPLSWKAHYVMLLLPSAYLILEVINSDRTRRRLIAGALLIALALFNFTSPRIIGIAAAEWADGHSLVFLGAMLIFVTSVVCALTGKFGNPRTVC